VAKGGRL